jgi:hypothetical protein
MRYFTLFLLLLGSVCFAQDTATRALMDDLTRAFEHKYRVEYSDRGDESFVQVHAQNLVGFHFQLNGAYTTPGETPELRQTTGIVEIYLSKMTREEYIALQRQKFAQLDEMNKWVARLSAIRQEPQFTGRADEAHRLLIMMKPADDQQRALVRQFRDFVNREAPMATLLPTHEYAGHLYRVASMVSDYPGVLEAGDIATVATAKYLVEKRMRALP